MRGFRSLLQLSGWRKTAAILLVLAWVISLVLSVCLVSTLKNAGSVAGAAVLFAGNCTAASRLNAILHIFINILSTGLLASSNFFMQVLASPSRSEIDRAHSQARWLDVGVPSWRNLRFISRTKSITLMLLGLCAIPLHLLFNSCVYETDALADYVAVFAAEPFLSGGSYYVPGAGDAAPAKGPQSGAPWETGLLNRTVAEISRSASAWERLDASRCRQLYFPQRASLRDRRDLVIVVNTGSDGRTQGWTEAEVWPTRAGSCTWEPGDCRADAESRGQPAEDCGTRAACETSAPTDAVNTLWHAGFCALRARFDAVSHSSPVCRRVFGGEPRTEDRDAAFESEGTWAISWWGDDFDRYYSSFANRSYDRLYPQYCLSEGFEGTCKVELSNALLLATCALALVKSMLCAWVLLRLRHLHPLTTLGDAIESFLVAPDPTTGNMCTYGQRDFAGADGFFWERSEHKQWVGQPRQWARSAKRWGSAVPRSVWVVTYLILSTIALASLGLLAEAVVANGGLRAAFGYNADNGGFRLAAYGGRADGQSLYGGTGTLLAAALAANTPQLIVSFCYIACNALFTRMLAAKEWAGLGTAHRPLRVTDPRGEQASTCFLALPLAFSAPLLCLSTLLHWLVSQSLYPFVSESGPSMDRSPGPETFNAASSPTSGAPSAVTVGVGHSPQALLGTLCVSAAILLWPALVSRRRLPGDMVLAGSCSAAISAACHAVPSPRSCQRDGERDEEDCSHGDGFGTESSQSAVLLHSDSFGSHYELRDPEDIRRTFLTDLARGRLKWGVVCARAGDGSNDAGHLSLGAESQKVEAPVEGCWYAGLPKT